MKRPIPSSTFIVAAILLMIDLVVIPIVLRQRQMTALGTLPASGNKGDMCDEKR